MPFTTDLIVMERGEKEWLLMEELRYKGNKDEFCVDAQFTTDFASVPRIFWNLIPPVGKYSKAAVIHDWLYVNKTVSRKDADGIFRRIMRENGVPKWKRYVMWAAVRAFGWIVWKK
jgi:hypothetical protein